MRKQNKLVLPDRGRELTFTIHEMSAFQLESWLMRAGNLLHADASETASSLSAEEKPFRAAKTLLQGGLRSLMHLEYEQVMPLLDDMLGCCSLVLPDGSELRCSRESMEPHIMDVQTLFRLRMEAIKLNMGFTAPERESSSGFQEKAPLEGQ